MYLKARKSISSILIICLRLLTHVKLSAFCMVDEVDNTVLDLPFVNEVDISDLLQADHDQEENIIPALHILTEEDLYELRKWVSSNDKVEET